jgi:hypothetical protein
MRRAWIVPSLTLALFGSPSLAGQPLCDGRFEVEGEPLLPGAGAPDAVVVEGGRVSIGGCTATRARTRATPEGTRARVRFSSWCARCGAVSFVGTVREFYASGGTGRWIHRCSGAKGVRLEVWVDPDCPALTGRLRARKPRLDREFVAVLAPPPAADCIPTSTDGACAE